MTWKELREHCLSLPGATETFPFEPNVSVFKAANGKMFAVTTSNAEPIDISVKSEPEIGEALRAQYESIAPGYHLNKRHWITITLNAGVPDERVRELVLDSYELVAPEDTHLSRMNPAPEISLACPVMRGRSRARPAWWSRSAARDAAAAA